MSSKRDAKEACGEAAITCAYASATLGAGGAILGAIPGGQVVGAIFWLGASAFGGIGAMSQHAANDPARDDFYVLEDLDFKSFDARERIGLKKDILDDQSLKMAESLFRFIDEAAYVSLFFRAYILSLERMQGASAATKANWLQKQRENAKNSARNLKERVRICAENAKLSANELEGSKFDPWIGTPEITKYIAELGKRGFEPIQKEYFEFIRLDESILQQPKVQKSLGKSSVAFFLAAEKLDKLANCIDDLINNQ
jgi:hypothetical protein